mmetsp:Transcript_5221/g.14963  ORF Transcript_5221/g.14963 Transcript_5221/m.14963 type:complete len:447 (-) Transcript_5221:750-2090(-)
MVGVHPINLLLGHRLNRHHLLLDRAHGQPLRAVVGHAAEPELRVGLAYDEEVFDTNAECAVLVVPWLVRADHAREEGLQVSEPVRDALGPLVDVERGADAMARAVPVVEPLLPERHPGERVERAAWGALRVDGHVERDVPLQHRRVALFLVLGRRAKVHRPGDVRRATVVLTAAVDEKERVRVDGAARLLLGPVMDHRPVGPAACNRGERRLDEPGLLAPLARQILINVHLGEDRPGGNGPVQPRQKLGQGHAVPDVGLNVPRQLLVVLDALCLVHRGGLAQNLALTTRRCPVLPLALLRIGHHPESLLGGHLECKAHLARVHPERPTLPSNVPRGLERLLVRSHRHPSLAQMLLHRRVAHLVHVHKQLGRRLRQQHVRAEHGIVRHVRATKVQQPRHLVQHRHRKRTRLVLQHLGAHLANLCFGRLPGPRDVVDAHRVIRRRRPP